MEQFYARIKRWNLNKTQTRMKSIIWLQINTTLRTGVTCYVSLRDSSKMALQLQLRPNEYKIIVNLGSWPGRAGGGGEGCVCVCVCILCKLTLSKRNFISKNHKSERQVLLCSFFGQFLSSFLTAWSIAPTSEPNGAYASREMPCINETRRFITAFTGASHLSLHWARTLQPIAPSNFLQIKFNIILSFMPRSSICTSPRVG